MIYSYYMTQRPPMPGAQPEGMISFVDYNERRFIPELGRKAWAIIRYERELTPEEISDYELVPASANIALSPAEVELLKEALRLIPSIGNPCMTDRAYELYLKIEAAM